MVKFTFLQVTLIVLIIGSLLSISSAFAEGEKSLRPITSHNRLFTAKPVGNFPQIDYEVCNNETGEVLFTTNSLENGVNDVKTGCFSPDAKYFAAVYMYGHDGTFTWVGIWDMVTGEMVKEQRRKGYVRSTSWIFKN